VDDVMIDIETMDNVPSAAILSIGAVRFDPKAGFIGEKFYARTSLEDCMAHGMTVSASTIVWWMQQSAAARESAFSNQLPLTDVLRDLGTFLGANAKVWANSPAFDLVILRNAYRISRLDVSWSYRAERCTRTVYDLADINLNDHREGVYHDAVADATSQACAVIAAYKRLFMIQCEAVQSRE
jgi:exodeoxyribonuclease VIII